MVSAVLDGVDADDVEDVVILDAAESLYHVGRETNRSKTSHGKLMMNRFLTSPRYRMNKIKLSTKLKDLKERQ